MTFVPNPDFLSELQADPEYVEALTEVADDIRAEALQIKHRIMSRRGFEGVMTVVDGSEVYVTNTDHGAHLDEWGSVNNPPYAPMRTAVNAAGFRLKEEPK